jgi:hypothetical protein
MVEAQSETKNNKLGFYNREGRGVQELWPRPLKKSRIFFKKTPLVKQENLIPDFSNLNLFEYKISPVYRSPKNRYWGNCTKLTDRRSNKTLCT